ncbi:peptide-methionine (S)-S-oxide reductase [Pseudoalteromonas ruthenica]|uniref:Peptide methionine sulfoxide reductase MsrA n=2 Tax=Pseudoalteromonas ruthenica TaxID=151081 RepID=A0A5S3Z7P1_9GAMM|nr:peptide-methionine (S)-S-oxide reductase [Pseudoalteromonas ruthenica]
MFNKLFFLLIFLVTSTAAMGADNNDAQMSVAKERVVLGAGCFWGVEKRFEALPGVLDAQSGYADGRGFKPTYKNIIAAKRRYDENNYAEVVRVTFNANAISLERILQFYFEQHDPTQVNRQGNDRGTQYRSTILTYSNEQTELAQRVKAQYQALLSEAGYGKIATLIKPLDKFHMAERYHQDYLRKNPNGYCPDHSTGVVFNAKETEHQDNTQLLEGKHIVVLDSPNYCPYCEKFKQEVLASYQGTIDVHLRYASQLQDLTITSETYATPTILFIENGQEVAAHQGYMPPELFYKALGAFKLGDSEAYRVAFAKGTDSRFCKQYEVFKNTPDGVFVDKLSGAPLFDTRDRFNSGTGWLSFTQPVAGQVTRHQDNSFGMQRIEIRSKSSGIHLGHVFPNEGPGGKARYCINATVLEFLPRDEFNGRS